MTPLQSINILYANSDVLKICNWNIYFELIFRCFAKIAVNEEKPSCIVFGTSLNNLFCLDLEKGTKHEVCDKTGTEIINYFNGLNK